MKIAYCIKCLHQQKNSQGFSGEVKMRLSVAKFDDLLLKSTSSFESNAHNSSAIQVDTFLSLAATNVAGVQLAVGHP